MKHNLIYISELHFPSSSAYAVHVMKMCEAFAQNKLNVTLICLSNNLSKKRYKKIYNIKIDFDLKSMFKDIKSSNFFIKIFYCVKILRSLKIKKNNDFIISRSIVCSIILSSLGYKNFLEIHHKTSGLTSIIFKLFRKLNLLKNIEFILIHKSLKDHFIHKEKNKYLILDDAVSLNDFHKKKREKKYSNTCVYTGSFYPGKGIEVIYKLAKKCKKINFHLYGDKKFLLSKNNFKNIKFFDYIPYFKVPNVLSKYEIALMPYAKKNYGRGNMEISESISPLKMFEYLASKKIILGSNLKAYNHILKHKQNSLLIDPNKIDEWSKNIIKIFKKKKQYSKLKINAFKTAKRYTWFKRAKTILEKFRLFYS